MPASSSVLLRPLWLSFPWMRSAALRRSSIAERSWSWMSLSLATFVATPVTPRLPISSSYTSRAVAKALRKLSRSSSSWIARFTYGFTS